MGIITESDIFRVFTEMMGGFTKGIRLTLLAPNIRGSLAQISTAIAQAGGYILAFNVFAGEDPSNWGAHMKVTDISQEALLEAVRPLVLEILDIREVK